MEKELLTTKELCDLLKVSRATVSLWVKEGMPYFTKNPYRYIFNDVVEWINKEK